MEFLRHRRAADDMPALEHGDLQPGRGEIGGADQPVMPAADDDDVGALRSAGDHRVTEAQIVWLQWEPHLVRRWLQAAG